MKSLYLDILTLLIIHWIRKSSKLDRVGPVDYRSLTDYIHNFVHNFCFVHLYIWNVTHDMWHVICDMWNMTCETWHVTYDTWHVVGVEYCTPLKCQRCHLFNLKQSGRLDNKILRKRVTHLMNKLMNEIVTRLATPGLLNK